jgi:hypothetical protein
VQKRQKDHDLLLDSNRSCVRWPDGVKNRPPWHYTRVRVCEGGFLQLTMTRPTLEKLRYLAGVEEPYGVPLPSGLCQQTKDGSVRGSERLLQRRVCRDAMRGTHLDRGDSTRATFAKFTGQAKRYRSLYLKFLCAKTCRRYRAILATRRSSGPALGLTSQPPPKARNDAAAALAASAWARARASLAANSALSAYSTSIRLITPRW